MGVPVRTFLVIDDNVDNRFLLTRTLQRKYPHARVHECGELPSALRIAAAGEIDAVVSHRAGEVDGLELVRELRRVNPTLPILMVSGFDRTRAALAAGATRFLNYDEWLRLGTVMDEIFTTQPWAALIGGLTHAIHAHAIVTFAYARDHGAATEHEVEPHMLGMKASGQYVLRAHGVASPLQRRPHGWETFLVERIHDFAITEHTFAPHNGERTADTEIAQVLCQA